VCGVKFKPKVPLQKTCSSYCSRKWRLHYVREYYKKNTDAHRETMRKYYKKHRDKYMKINRKWRENNKEYFSNYTQKIYPEKHVRKICNKYDYGIATTEALIKGGKTLDEQLAQMLKSNNKITIKMGGVNK